MDWSAQTGSPIQWIAFVGFVAAMLALDLGVFHRKAHTVSMKEAAIWTSVWIALALLFNLFVFWRWGFGAGQAFLTGYLIEKGLSVDNLFVFYLIFSSFSVKPEHQHRLLFWGILGAIVLRAAMIFGGAYLLDRFHWLVYLFGGVLVLTGLKMLVRRHETPHPERGRVFRLVQRVIPSTHEQHGGKLFARENGALLATPLFLVLVLIELTDIVFAVDSILAIFAVTTDPFIVFTSNIFAILGMRSLYFVLADVTRRFAYLQPGLAIILIFVGVKMAISSFVKIPVVASLLVVVTLLGGSIVMSLVRSRREQRRAEHAQASA